MPFAVRLPRWVKASRRVPVPCLVRGGRPAPRAELLRFLLLPEREGAERIGNPAEDVNVRRELPFD